MTIAALTDFIRRAGGDLPDDIALWWSALGLEGYDADRIVTRLEAAVALDAALDTFDRFDVDYEGNIIR